MRANIIGLKKQKNEYVGKIGTSLKQFDDSKIVVKTIDE